MRATLSRRRLTALVLIALCVLGLLLWRTTRTEPVGPRAMCGGATGIECRSGVVRIDAGDTQARSLGLSALVPPRPPATVLVGRNSTELAVAAGVATSLNGPLIVLSAAGLSPEVDAELARLRPERVIVIGHDETARAVADLLQVPGRLPETRQVTLVAAPTPAGVAAAAAAMFPRHTPVAYVMTYQDSESVVTAAALLAQAPGPVLIAHYGSVPQETAVALATLAPRRLVLIGDHRKLTDQVVQRLTRYAGAGVSEPATRVLTGPRDTSVLLSARHGGEVREAYLVSVADPAGAVAAAPVAARVGAPVLVTGYELTDEVGAAIADLGADSVVMVGSGGVLGPRTQERVAALLE